jgi:regulator of replication initiation timing
MTTWGKRLVFLNLVLSLMFVAWALGLVTNQVPWHTPPATDGVKVQGLVAANLEQMKQLQAARDAADTRYNDALAELNAVERVRPYNLAYYADMLRSARLGGVAAINPPVPKLEFGQNNAVAIPAPQQRANRPAVQIDGQNAQPVAAYVKAILDAVAAIQKAQAAEKQLTAEMEALTKQINGLKPRGEAVNAEEKGLRTQLAEQQELAKHLRLEQEYLQSPLTYLLLQKEQLDKRQAALAARLNELKAAPTALGRRP